MLTLEEAQELRDCIEHVIGCDHGDAPMESLERALELSTNLVLETARLEGKLPDGL